MHNVPAILASQSMPAGQSWQDASAVHYQAPASAPQGLQAPPPMPAPPAPSGVQATQAPPSVLPRQITSAPISLGIPPPQPAYASRYTPALQSTSRARPWSANTSVYSHYSPSMQAYPLLCSNYSAKNGYYPPTTGQSHATSATDSSTYNGRSL
jgi:hypothetical protein